MLRRDAIRAADRPDWLAGALLHRRRQRPWRWLAVLLLLAAVAAGGWQLWGRPVAVTAVRPWRGPAIEAVYATSPSGSAPKPATSPRPAIR